MLFEKRFTGLSMLVLLLLLLTACGGTKLSDEGNDVSGQDWIVEDFTSTTESGEPLSLKDLEGEVWLADFIFSNCTTVCGPMSAHMSKVQQLLEDEGVEVPIVSFTVDPERDTPEALKKYADQYGANLSTWHFVTGYSFEEIKELSVNSFKSPLEKPMEGDDQFTHGVFFYLIQNDKIIKTYNGVKDTPIEAIVQDAKALKEGL